MRPPKLILRLVAMVWIGCLVQPSFADEWVYTFRPGDTLWDLCKKYIAAPNCWQKIATRNNVEQPKEIKPGTRLYLPIAWLKVRPASATALSVRGDVLVMQVDSEEPILLKTNAEIVVGDQIITREGTVTLKFADESILIITPGSEVTFDTMTMYGESGMVDTRMRLNRGRARAKVKRVQGPASRYEILTPAAVAAVRGTEFRVVSEATDPPQMRTEVLEGNVALGNETGEQSIAQGYAAKAVAGEGVEEPVKLLLPPTFSTHLPEVLSAFPWRLNWHPIEGANAYRLQIYLRGFLFDDLLLEEKLNEPGYSIAHLKEGQYELKVRAVDQNGFEGLERGYIFAVAGAKNVAPIRVSAEVKTTADQSSIRWQWQGVEGADKYQLLLTSSDQSEQKKLEVVEPYFQQAVPGPGEYQLQVAPVLGEQLLPYGDVKKVSVNDPNQPPAWAQAIVFLTILLAIF